MAVAPAVAPATVLGLLGGLVSLVASGPGAFLGLGSRCHRRLDRGRRHPPGSSPAGLRGVGHRTRGAPAPDPRLRRRRAWWSGWMLARRRRTAIGLALPRPGRAPAAAPPRAGHRPAGCWWPATSARVTGWSSTPVTAPPSSSTPGPTRTRCGGCLARLAVREVPVVVLTHFHADHVDGLAGVLDDYDVTTLVTSSADDPPGTAATVGRLADAEGADVEVAEQGQITRVGDLVWQVLGPPARPPGPGVQGSAANNASVVLLAEVAGRADPAHRRHRARGPGCRCPDRTGPRRSMCSRCRTTAAATRTPTGCAACRQVSRWSRWGRATTTATRRQG